MNLFLFNRVVIQDEHMKESDQRTRNPGMCNGCPVTLTVASKKRMWRKYHSMEILILWY